jgi:hypothetical protein
MADMILTNQTANDYTFGPYHLLGGVGQQITIDTTTNASLYLTDDAVADIVNALYVGGLVTASNPPTPFPRVTGVPEILHGDGTPEGVVFAHQGSLFMRRDNSSSSNAMYAKTSGPSLATGWQAFGGTSGEPAVSTLPGGPYNGQVVRLRLGASPYAFMRLVYDSTYAHWVADERVVAFGGSNNNNNTANAWQTASAPFSFTMVQYGLFATAGLTLQLRAVAVINSNGTASLDAGVQCTPYNIGGAAGTPSTDAALTGMSALTTATPTLRDSGWVSAPSFTSADFALIVPRIRSNTNNIGTWSNFTISARWIG